MYKEMNAVIPMKHIIVMQIDIVVSFMATPHAVAAATENHRRLPLP